MGALIDSSIFIAAERGQLDLERVLREQPDEPIALAAITASELLHGLHRTATPAQRRRRESFVESLLSELPVVSFDLVTARIHASLWAELAAKGTPIGAHDLLIAATALTLGYDVATRDQRSFLKIPGLKVVRW
jgi:predicted nucleic acid-binding protein